MDDAMTDTPNETANETTNETAHRQTYRHRLIATVVLIAAVVLMTAAPSQAAAAKRIDVPIALDARVIVKGTPFTVKFESVIDSRCPPDVVCVWAGQLEVSIRIFASGTSKKGSARTLIFHPGQPPQKDSVMQLKGWWFGLVESGDDVILRVQTTPIR
jgi:hypothetical protein